MLRTLKIAAVVILAVVLAFLVGRCQGGRRIPSLERELNAARALLEQGFREPTPGKPTVPSLPAGASPLATLTGSVPARIRRSVQPLGSGYSPSPVAAGGGADSARAGAVSPPTAPAAGPPNVEWSPWPASGDLSCRGSCELVQVGDRVLGRFSCGAALHSEDRTWVVEREPEPAGETELHISRKLLPSKKWWAAVRVGLELGDGAIRPEVGASYGRGLFGGYARVTVGQVNGGWTATSGAAGLEVRF